MAQLDYNVPTMNTSELLGSTEAAELLGVTRRQITRYALSGKLPVALKTKGRTGTYLFRRSDVEALAAARHQESAA